MAQACDGEETRTILKKESTSSNPVDAKGDTDLTAQTNEDVALTGAKLQKVLETGNSV